MNGCSAALSEYMPAFSDPDAPFLTCHRILADKSVARREFTRGEFLSLARKAAAVLRRCGRGPGGRFAHYFSGNRHEDLAFRLAATMVGAVPVTINWQADTPDRIAYKIELTESGLVVHDQGVPDDALESLTERFPGLRLYVAEELPSEPELPEREWCREDDLGPDATRIIIFTSGTTGHPKGVRLPYRSYRTNRLTFESFLQVAPGDLFAPLIVNPLHHTNSTAITDWALRRPGTRLHLVERYSTRYWAIVTRVADRGYGRIVAPTVSRHFDYLENLIQQDRLPVGLDELHAAMRRVDFLIGSAPVGPTTVRRLQKHAGRIPLVRFGSTETCLQVMGTPVDMAEERKLEAFRAGWSHTWRGETQPGYYVGRPHPPHTECRIVQSADRKSPDYLVDCKEGEPGYVITRGANVMSGYVRDPDETARVLHDGGWYSGLGDVCFWLTNVNDGGRDYYWMSRESALLVRGGANYAYAQINAELKEFVGKRYNLAEDAFDVAVVGLRIDSEHEDDCCVTIELLSDEAKARQTDIGGTFMDEARAAVTKGARPNRLRFAPIPRNFKGAILVPQLKQQYRSTIAGGGETRSGEGSATGARC